MKYRVTMISAILMASFAVFAQTQSQSSGAPQHQPGLSAPATAAPAKVEPEKEKAILHLMQITGASKDGDNMTMMLSAQVKNAVSRSMTGDRLQKFVDDFNSKLTAKSPANEVTNAEVAIYAQNFSMEDLQGMIQFYESPLGQRVMKALPEVLQQTQRQGATIERTAALDTLKGMTGDYPEIKPLLPEDQKPTLAPGTPQQPKPPAQPQQPQK